jgi:hypothetical protein
MRPPRAQYWVLVALRAQLHAHVQHSSLLWDWPTFPLHTHIALKLPDAFLFPLWATIELTVSGLTPPPTAPCMQPYSYQAYPLVPAHS